MNDKEGTCVILEEVSTRDHRGNRTLTTLSRTRITTMEDSPTKEQLCLQDWRNKGGLDEEFEDLAVPYE